MPQKKVRIGVLGCSSIAERQVVPAILQTDRFELRYVASRTNQKGKLFSEKFKCDFCGYEALISSDQIDAVYLSLPVGLHYQWGKKVVEKGKHLLMEKTFTDSLQKAKEIILLSRNKKLVAMEALAYVYHPLYKKVLSLIKGGEIGQVKHIEAHFGFPLPGENDFRIKPDLGGGAILDALIYPLSFALNVSNETLGKVSHCLRFNNKYRIDEQGSLLIDLGTIFASINYGFGLMYRNQYCIWGSDGYLMADRVFTRPVDFINEIVLVTPNESKKIPVVADNQFVNMLNAFADKIFLKSSDSLNEGENITARMKIISELYKYTMEHSKKQNEK